VQGRWHLDSVNAVQIRSGLNGDVWAHNPEVAGSNPAPATKTAGQRPLPILEGAFSLSRANGFANAVASECPADSAALALKAGIPGIGECGVRLQGLDRRPTAGLWVACPEETGPRVAA
jgi:hypothetical protein